MYEKQTWVTGDVITAEKLNKLENGVASGGGIFIVPVTFTIPPGDNPFSTDIAFADVQNAAINGNVLVYSIRTVVSGELRKIESAFGKYDVGLQIVHIDVNGESLVHSSSGITADGSPA